MQEEVRQHATVLIVDDTSTNLAVLSDYLQEAGFATLTAQSGKEAIERAEAKHPDLLLLDVTMPEMDGLETCRHLKANERTRNIPVIFMAAVSEKIAKFTGYEAGGCDYITKPCEGIELLARMKIHLEMRRLRSDVEDLTSQLQECQEKLELAERIDPLTRIANRHEMMERLAYERIRFERNRQPFAVLLGDIDNFKGYNDTFGHDCGDFILVTVAEIMRSMIRKQDCLARWGGEEFLFLLPETDLKGAAVIAEKVRKEIAERSYEFHGVRFSLTMTFGVNVFDRDMRLDAYLQKTDQALSEGKRCGKNCISLA